METYRFYGWEQACISPSDPEYAGIRSPRMLYDLLSDYCWCAETCTPRMRNGWSPANRTLGQCSITAFLAQDIVGGHVFGVPLGDGNFHCFNDVDGCVFDLTSEQFGETVLDYAHCSEQFRENHFAKEEKGLRYELLRRLLRRRLGLEKT